MLSFISSIGQAIGTVLNFIVSTITGLITIFGLVSQSFVFLIRSFWCSHRCWLFLALPVLLSRFSCF